MGTTGGTLYEEVAGRIEQMIARGTLRPGERIPSIRRLHRPMFSASGRYGHCMRLNAASWSVAIEDAVARLGALVVGQLGGRSKDEGRAAPP